MSSSGHDFQLNSVDVRGSVAYYIMILISLHHKNVDCIGGVMVSVLAWNAVDRGFEPRSGQTKDYLIGICCFTAKHAALRRKRKDWLARNQDNVSQWGDMSIRGLLFSVN